MADEHDQQAHVCDREDTMLYRKPGPDADEAAIADIWGSKLETRVVDANSEEFSRYLADGWVRNPADIDGVGTQAPPPGFERVPRSSGAGDAVKDALDAAEKLAQELGVQVQSLTKERDDALEGAKAAHEACLAAQTDLSAEKALRQASAEHIKKLEGQIADLKKVPKRS